MNKTTLVNTVKERLSHKVSNLEKIIAETQQSNSETKSSMGDKYETTREMVAQEIRNLQRQLSEVQNQRETLTKLTATASHTVELGALVETGTGLFYISAAAGEITWEGRKVMTVSPHAPLVKAMQNLKCGDSFSLNSVNHTIVAIS